MKKRYYLYTLVLLATSAALQAQELVPLAANPVLETTLSEAYIAESKTWRAAASALQKSDCVIENPDEVYVTAGDTAFIAIAIDTFGLGGGPGTFSCVNCQSAEFGSAALVGDTLRYTARPDVIAGKEGITVQFCNANGCRTRTYRMVARRANRNHFFITVPIGPDGLAVVPTNVNGLLPGKRAVCHDFLDCPDNYEGAARRVLISVRGDSLLYFAGRYAGLDSVCIALCDTFAICDTFRFSFRVQGDTLNLPFMDDFSYSGPYPLASHWLDRDVFVNNDMAQDPPSFGAATFDGLNSEGTAYGGGYGKADQLTSRYLNLSGIPGEVYLTYWLQRRGFGDRPEPEDSIVLEFKDRTGKWVHVQGYPGIPPNQPNTVPEPFRFYRQQIPAEFKYRGFQFRFKNFSERTGLLDVWHLDYVRVDNNFTDSIFNDVAFTRQPDFILENYSSMPWRHFNDFAGKELRDNIDVGIWNHAATPLNANPSLVRLFETRSNVEVFNVTLFNGVEANVENGFPVARNYLFAADPTGFPPVSADLLQIMSGPAFDDFERLNFRMTYQLSNTSQINTPGYEAVGRNNSVNRFTVFDNYFAYDDGTAEAGLIAQEGVQVALKYTANVEDSLRAIQIHFPRTTIDVSNQEFNLQVWVGALDNTPEYEQVLLRPLYADAVLDTLQGFTTYVLVDENDNPKPLYLPPGDFYIGWQQVSRCDGTKCIPVGYDRNSPRGAANMFRYFQGRWQPFPPNFPIGSLMLRPVVGNTTPPATTSVDAPLLPARNFTLFPNPTQGILNVRPQEGYPEDFIFRIFSPTGQLMRSGTLSAQIDVHTLTPGVYLLHIAEQRSGRTWRERFVIAR